MTKNSCSKCKKSKNVLEILVSKPFIFIQLYDACFASLLTFYRHMLGRLLISSPPSSENRPHPPSPALHEQCLYLPLHVSDHEGTLSQVMVITLSYNTKVFQDIFWICLSLQGLNKGLVLVASLWFYNYEETSKQLNKRNEFSRVLHDRWGDHMRDHIWTGGLPDLPWVYHLHVNK